MKNFAILTAFLFFSIALPGQSKHDYIWLFGYPPNIEQDSFGGTKLDFNATPREVTFFETPLNLLQSTMISDLSGDFIFYTNGCEIRNRFHQIIENGDSINPGRVHNNYCSHGYPRTQGLLMLPQPGDEDIYFLFHLRVNDQLVTTDLMFTIMDAAAANDSGAVLQKNILLFQDTLVDQLTAVKHANGRDWWIIVPKVASNRHFVFLFSSAGVEGPWMQDVGQPWTFETWSGQACFSPDGQKYIRMNPFNGLHIYDFDRCTGTLSNPLAIDFPDNEVGFASSGGVSVSPNNRFLYVSFFTFVYQFDLYAANIAASRQTVAVYDGFMSPLWTTFYQHASGPDGKIYITANNSVNRLHIIHRPNEPGEACDLEQHGLRLAGLHAFAAPNFPHFRLWDVEGSLCDTLGIDAPVSVREERAPFDVRLFPNPADDRVILLFEGPAQGPVTLLVFNAMGQLALKRTFAHAGRHEIGLQGLPAGVYFAQVVMDSGERRGFKLVKR
jgi:hypothetical protein